MDFVERTDETMIHLIVEPTIAAFLPHLEKKRSEIFSVAKKTFKYGDTDRHTLDVYYPATSSKKPPILVFVYGGGYYSGDRVFPPPCDVAYTNVGAFFARLGFLTVIPDYRIHPNAVYPQPSEDVRDALAFTVRELGDAGDVDTIFLLGHSAGAGIIATLLLREPPLLEEGAATGLGIAKRLKGTVLLGGAYHFDGPVSAPPHVIADFYGEKIKQHVPLGLMEAASQQTLDALPPLYLVLSEKDAPGIVIAHSDFVDAVNKRLGKRVDTGIAKGHNHISITWALGTGEGEEWAEEVAEWLKKRKA